MRNFHQAVTRGPAESWRDLFDYFNIDYFKIVLKFQVSQVDSALPTQKRGLGQWSFLQPGLSIKPLIPNLDG